MTKVAILPIPTEKGGHSYQGVSGDKTSHGSTPGEALDALTVQFPDDEDGLVVIVQSLRADAFFGAAEQQRLGELMQAWRTAQEAGRVLPAAEQTELDMLVGKELRASAHRAGALADDLGS